MNKRYKQPELIRQPYELTANFIKYKFSAGENRVLVRVLQRIKVYQEILYSPQIDLDGNVEMEFHWKDLVLENQNTKTRLEDDLKALREKSLAVEGRGVFDGVEQRTTTLIGVIEKPEWNDARSHVRLRLDERLYGFLTDLSRGYTEYLADSSFKLSGAYSIKMYYFIRQWRDKGGRSLTLDQFRKELEVSKEKYKKNTASEFKRYILNPAKAELDKIADMSFNYSEIKEGKKITGFVLKFYQTNNPQVSPKNIQRAEELFDLFDDRFDLSADVRGRIIGLMNKYQFSFLKTLIKTHYMDIWEKYQQYKDLPNAINRIIIDNYSHIFNEKPEAN